MAPTRTAKPAPTSFPAIGAGVAAAPVKLEMMGATGAVLEAATSVDHVDGLTSVTGATVDFLAELQSAHTEEVTIGAGAEELGCQSFQLETTGTTGVVTGAGADQSCHLLDTTGTTGVVVGAGADQSCHLLEEMTGTIGVVVGAGADQSCHLLDTTGTMGVVVGAGAEDQSCHLLVAMGVVVGAGAEDQSCHLLDETGTTGVVVGAGAEDQSSHLLDETGFAEVVVGFGLLEEATELQSCQTDEVTTTGVVAGVVTTTGVVHSFHSEVTTGVKFWFRF